MGMLLSCLASDDNKRFREYLNNSATETIWQFRAEMPRYRFLTYIALSLLFIIIGGSSQASEAFMGYWFYGLAACTGLMAFYYPVLFSFTPEHMGMRIKLFQLLCINDGWIVFPKNMVLSITDNYKDHNKLKMCETGPFCCAPLAFEDWSNLDRRNSVKTLTFEMDDSVAWGKYITVMMDPPAEIAFVQDKTLIKLKGDGASSTAIANQGARQFQAQQTPGGNGAVVQTNVQRGQGTA
jgi:hypothetical protein